MARKNHEKQQSILEEATKGQKQMSSKPPKHLVANQILHSNRQPGHHHNALSSHDLQLARGADTRVVDKNINMSYDSFTRNQAQNQMFGNIKNSKGVNGA